MPRTSEQGRSTLPQTAAAAQATTSMEDYAKVIYRLTEWERAEVTTSSLAKALGVAAPSASLMLRKMADLQLVARQPYAPVRLTESGRRLALAMVRRHRLIETWLVDELGYTWDEVHDEAERLEHVVSEVFIERLDAKLGHPDTDPHGDRIPAKDLSLDYPETTLLCRARAGDRVRIEQVDDSVLEALHQLTQAELTIGDEVTVTRTASEQVLLRRRAEAAEIVLSHTVAHAVRVSIAP